MNDHLSAIRRHTRAAQIGRTHPASATVKLSSIATFTLPSQLTELCSPPTGMVWFVERITFAPPMLGTGAGGTIILFRGSVECWRTPPSGGPPNTLTSDGYAFMLQTGEVLSAVWYAPTVAGDLVVDIAAAEQPALGPATVTA